MAGEDIYIKVGETLQFDGSGSSDDVGIAAYRWTFNDSVEHLLTGVSPSYTFNNLGRFAITLEVSDAAGNSDIDIITVIVYRPTLSWTGEKAFIGDGIHPESGLVGDSFHFRIMYRDEYAARAPDHVKLYLEYPNELGIEIWEDYPLTALDNNDNYALGVIYCMDVSLFEAGQYRYYFEAEFGKNKGTVRMPSADLVYMDAPMVNTPPSVSGSVYRTYGVETSSFSYSATFTDPDNDPADPKHSFVYIDGTPYLMIEKNVLDRNTDNGKDYYFEKNGLEEGPHEYYFHFKDSFGTSNEIDPSNRGYHPIVYEGWPDLKISPSDIGFEEDPETSNLVVNVTVHNIGKGSARDIPVTIWVDDPDANGDLFEPLSNISGNHHYIISLLERGRSNTTKWITNIQYNNTQKGSFYAVADMDYEGTTDPFSPLARARRREDGIKEIIEYSDSNTNNKARNIFAFGPDIEIRRTDVSPQSVILGRNIKFTAKIRNVGNEDVHYDQDHDIIVRFKLKPPKSEELINVGSYTIGGGLRTGQWQNAEKKYHFSGPAETSVGKWELLVTAEIVGGFSETEYDNNAIIVNVNVIKIRGSTAAPSFSPTFFSILIGLLVIAIPLTWLQTRRHER